MKKYILIAFAISLLSNVIKAQPSFWNPQPRGSVFYNSALWLMWNGMGASGTILPIHNEGFAQLNDTSLIAAPIFSTNGIGVYNSFGVEIAGAPFLIGNTNSTNSAQIVRLSNGKAMIITLESISSALNRAAYTIVDVTVPATPIVPLATRNILISGGGISRFSEKSVITQKFGTNNYWLILHEFVPGMAFTNRYVVFEIDAAAATVTYANTYALGTFIRTTGHKGQMKASYAQTKSIIAAAHLSNNTPAIGGSVDVLILDNITGALVLKEAVNLDGPALMPYGLEFSSFGNYLYFTSINVASSTSRADPNAMGAGAVFGSLDINSSLWCPPSIFCQMQRMSNGAIYFPSFGTTRLNSLLNAQLIGSHTAFELAGPSVTSLATLRAGIASYPAIY